MTILIIGGAAQGKSAFARTLSPEQDIIDDLHVRVQQALRDNTALPQAAEFAGKTVAVSYTHLTLPTTPYV